MENLRNRINARLVNNEKDCLNYTSKPGYMLHKIFDKNLVAIRRSKIALKLNKLAYIGMCTLGLSKESTNSIIITLKINITTNQNYHSQTLIV